MKVKRTYGRQGTRKIQDSPRDDTFDRLLVDNEKPESPKLVAKPAPRATYNRDSSLDESKVIRKAKPKRQQASKAIKKIQRVIADSSHDELYESYLRQKKQKLALKRKERSQRSSALNVQISTPKGMLKKSKGKGLMFEVSPIRLNETVGSDDSYLDKKMMDSIRRQRMEEIETKELDSSAIREAKALMAGLKKIKSTREMPATITTTQAAKQKRESLKEVPAVRNSLDELELNSLDEDKESTNTKELSTAKRSSVSIPSIKITSPELHETDEASERDAESDKENSLQSPSKFFGPPSIEQEDEVELPVVTRKRKSLPTLGASPARKRTLIAEASTSVCDTAAASPVIQEIVKQIAKKSVKISDLPVPSQRSTRGSLINRGKKSIRFAEIPEVEKIVLQPGKSWRRSLINHRKSLHGNDRGSNNRRTTVIIEEEEEESLPAVKRYTEKLLGTLGESVLLEQSDEGNLHAALSILDSSIKCAATFHDQRKTCQRQTSVFQRSSIFYGLQTPLIDAAPTLSARQIALRRCGQQDPLPFDELYAESQLPNCCKIGEGVYGEVFMYKCPTTHQPIVLKIIPIEGDLLINGEPQKRFDEILQEIVISMELSALRNGKDFATDGFVNVKRVSCVQGAYPLHLIDEWELYRDNRVEGSDNDHPEIFPYDQLYVVFELCNGGRDLEAFVFNNAEEAQSIFLQTALTLAVAEQKFEFEHRDLHWGNILIAPTTEKFVEYRFKGEVVKLLTHGVKVTIIDYSLSRMVYDGAVLFDNLARDEELFQSTGDYQFDIYRLMRERVENQFERYEPYTNLLWLHYIVDKLINGARYRYSKTKKHRAAVNEMMQERDELLNFKSASDYISTLDV